MTLVVIDDDPTGAQTLRDVPLVFGVDAELVRQYLEAGTPTLCVLTNSRAESAAAAADANRAVARILRDACPAEVPLVASRGDSTLRGHLRAETAALAAELHPGTTPRFVFAPAFVEAGRTTVDGVHYVLMDGQRTPVAETPFARDARFGYRSSDLRDYLVEIGAVAAAAEVSLVGSAALEQGPQALVEAITAAPGWVVADAQNIGHIDAIAAGIRAAHAITGDVIARCAPSLVRALAGQEARPALTDTELAAAFPLRSGHGLLVVGSHVPQTTTQVAVLRSELPDLTLLEIPIDILLSAEPSAREALVADVVAHLRHGDVALTTPRTELRDTSDDGHVARTISDALSDIVAAISSATPLAWVIAKGGITSHETAARGLGIRAATVVGQLFDNTVSVVRPTAAPTNVAGMPYVIFPGNVGAADAVAGAVRRMRALVAASAAAIREGEQE